MKDIGQGSGASRPEAIRIENLHKSFGQLEVLKGVSLRACEGDVVAIIGGSGSGKSTMLRCINFLETPTSGKIVIGGEEVKMRAEGGAADRKQLERLRQSLGMVFQSFNLWTHKTVMENLIEVPVHVLGVPKAEAVARAEKVLARVGLAEKAAVYPAFMSGGQQQRAAIARAMVQRASLVLADEPIASLDPEAARRVMESLAELNRADGVTVLVSLHQVQFAMHYCPRTVALRAGKVVFDGPTADLTAHKLGELYGAEAEEFLLGEALPAAARHKPRNVVGFPQPAEALAVAAAG